MIDITAKIEEIRNKKGITQKKMGEMLGISQQSYSQYMNVNTDLTLSMIEQIAKIYNMSIVDLVMYPQKYVPEGQASVVMCDECRKKDEIIENLNEYIKILKNKSHE